MIEIAGRWHLALAAMSLVGGVAALALTSVRWLRPRPFVVIVPILIAVAAHAGLPLGVWILGAAPGCVVSLVSGSTERARPRGGAMVIRVSAGALLTLAGVWATVPDTEAALIALLVSAPTVGWMGIRGRILARGDLVTVAGLAVVAIAQGSAGRTPAWLGGACCVSWIVTSVFSVPARTSGTLLTTHVSAIIVGSRVVAKAQPAGAAAIAAGVVASVGLVALAVEIRARRSSHVDAPRCS